MPVISFVGGVNPREFGISPAVNGKTTWNLDTDGPLEIMQAGTWTLTLPPVWLATMELWGGGGGGSGASLPTSFTNETSGGNSTFRTLTAFGGLRAYNSRPSLTPSPGGTATGGDSNEDGEASGTDGKGGDGGGSNGGAGGAAPTSSPQNGNNGSAPGGAGSGSRTSPSVVFHGGSGGGKCTKDWSGTQFDFEEQVVLTIGAAGTGGDGNQLDGGNGAPGGVRIS